MSGPLFSRFRCIPGYPAVSSLFSARYVFTKDSTSFYRMRPACVGGSTEKIFTVRNYILKRLGNSGNYSSVKDTTEIARMCCVYVCFLCCVILFECHNTRFVFFCRHAFFVCAHFGLQSLCSTSPPAETRLTVYRRSAIVPSFTGSLMWLQVK